MPSQRHVFSQDILSDNQEVRAEYANRANYHTKPLLVFFAGNMPQIPLEIKSLVISELEPLPHLEFDLKVFEKEEAAYHKDLRAVCLVWPDTIRIIRKILFRTVAILADEQNVDTSLRNLSQALENDPSIVRFVHILELYDQSTSQELCAISDHPLFKSIMAYVSQMDHLTDIVLYGIRDFMSTESIASLCASRAPWALNCNMAMCEFSDARAFSTFLSCWTTAGLDKLEIEGLSLRPTISEAELSRALRAFVNDWDKESTWIRWNMVDKPNRSSFLSLRSLEFVYPEIPPPIPDCSGFLMIMDLFTSTEWSPLKALENLRVRGAFMENSFVHRVNNLIRRYRSTLKCLRLEYMQSGTPGNIRLDFPSVERVIFQAWVDLTFGLIAAETHVMDCYIKSLAAVPSGSQLKSVEFNFYTQPPDSHPLPHYSWNELDAAVAGDNLELETLNFNVHCHTNSEDLPWLREFILEHVFPNVAAKYFSADGAKSALTLLEV